MTRKRKPVKVDYAAWGTAINQCAYDEWREYRQEIKKPLSRLTVEKQLAMLAQYPPHAQQQIIDQSICCGWIGLFPPKQRRYMDAPQSTRSTSIADDLTDTSWLH